MIRASVIFALLAVALACTTQWIAAQQQQSAAPTAQQAKAANSNTAPAPRTVTASANARPHRRREKIPRQLFPLPSNSAQVFAESDGNDRPSHESPRNAYRRGRAPHPEIHEPIDMTPSPPTHSQAVRLAARALTGTLLLATAIWYCAAAVHAQAQAPSESKDHPSVQQTVPLVGSPHSGPEPQLIEILADRDSRYKIAGQDKPVITLTAGQEVRLRITAVKAKNRNRDGSIHGFTLLRSKDRTPVPGWDFLLMPGVQDFLVTAPAEPGDYQVVCTVICSSGHEQMNMKDHCCF